MKLTIIGHDNVLLRSYLYLLRNSNKYQVNLILFPQLLKNCNVINEVSKFEKKSIFEKNTSKLNLKIPIEFWSNKNIDNFLYNYFYTNFEIDVSEFKQFLQIKLRKIEIVEKVDFYYSKYFDIKTLESINFNNYENYILNTANFIYSKTLLNNLNNQVYHVHPGYLPDLKGADGIFWSIYKHEKIGMSIFKMNEKIDQGKIYSRSYFKYEKIKNNYLMNLSDKNKYNFLLSTLDPLLRAKFFYDKGLDSLSNKNYLENKAGNYHTFMKDSELEKTYEKIFY